MFSVQQMGWAATQMSKTCVLHAAAGHCLTAMVSDTTFLKCGAPGGAEPLCGESVSGHLSHWLVLPFGHTMWVSVGQHMHFAPQSVTFLGAPNVGIDKHMHFAPQSVAVPSLGHPMCV